MLLYSSPSDVRSRVELLLLRLSFDNCPSPGTMMSKTGYPEPLAKRALARKRDSEAIEGVTGAASGGVQKAFLAASVPDRLPHTLQEASEVHFGTDFDLCPFRIPGITLSPPCEPLSHAGEAILCLHVYRRCLSVAACCGAFRNLNASDVSRIVRPQL